MSAPAGKVFEDFHVGDRHRSRLGRTITQADNIWFTLLTNNSNQIHFNEHYASKTAFKRPLVNSFATMAIVAGLMVPDTSENGFALGVDETTFPNPLYEGDTLYADTEVLEVRESKSRPGWGVVRVRQRGIKQDGTIVVVMTRTIMVPARAAASAAEHFPEPKP